MNEEGHLASSRWGNKGLFPLLLCHVYQLRPVLQKEPSLVATDVGRIPVEGWLLQTPSSLGLSWEASQCPVLPGGLSSVTTQGLSGGFYCSDLPSLSSPVSSLKQDLSEA